MRKRVELMSLWINFSQPTAENMPAIVFAGIWLLCLVYIFLNELVEISYAIRNAEARWHRALLEDYIGLWNVVAWLKHHDTGVIGAWVVTINEQIESSHPSSFVAADAFCAG